MENVVISNKGKELLCDRYVTPRRSDWVDLDQRIHRLLVGTSDETELMISTRELPLRWASGGVLSLIKCGGKLWVPLFFRDIAPVGWNISLGSSERCFDERGKPKSKTAFSLERELSEPWKFIVREFLEETLILDSKPTLGGTCGRRKFHFSRSRNVRIAEEQAAKFSDEHLRFRRNDDGLTFGRGEAIRVQIVDETDTDLTITGQDEEDCVDWDVLVVINPLELGIEVIKVFEYNIEENDCMLDGEILSKGNTEELVRMPFALISLKVINTYFNCSKHGRRLAGKYENRTKI